MQASTKKIVKRIGWIAISLFLILAISGGYFYSILPKPAGKVPELQHELFEPPMTRNILNGRYVYKSAVQLAAMIRNKEVTSAAIVTDVINYIKQNNYKYNALVWLLEAQAIRDARHADSLLAKGIILGPLHGVPITVKEQFSVEASYLTLNAKMIGGFKPIKDQALVKQLRDAGAIIIGTTNVPYMLLDYQTYGEIYPPASNPYDTTRTPGGSTGGGAAAVAAGFVPLEMGGDMGGSVRVPSAYCGLYGLKTTEKALDLWDQEFPGMKFDNKYASLAVAGPIARTPEDLELMWNVLKGTPNQFMKSVPYQYDTLKALSQYKIAWSDELKFGDKILPVHPDIKQGLNTLVDSLHLHQVSTDHIMPATFNDQFKVFIALMGFMNTYGQPWLMRKLIMMGFKSFDDGSVDLTKSYELGISQDNKKYDELIELRKKLIATWDAFFEQHDFLICPVMPMPAIKKCERGTPVLIDGHQVPYWNTGAYAFMVNATGHPSITIPLGLNQEGLPIGVQVIGKYYSEPQLIHFAKQLEGITPGFIKPTAL